MTDHLDQPSGKPDTAGLHILVGTPVLDASGREGTVTHSAPGTAVVRFSDGTEASVDPDRLRTADDLWAELARIAASLPSANDMSIFALSDYADAAHDPDVRYIPWRHVLSEVDATWGARYPDTDQAQLFVRLVSYGDYSGTSCDASNYRVLWSRFGGATPFTPLASSMSWVRPLVSA